MMTHEVHEDRRPDGRSGPHHLLPIAGIGVVVIGALAHLGGGAMLAHVGIGAVIAYFGADVANLGGGALVVGLAAIITIKLMFLFVFGGTLMSKTHSGMTTGKTIHRPRFYDACVALLTLGRGRSLRDRTIALAAIALGEHVLDIGCGTGEIAMRAKARSGATGSVVGIDPAPEMIAVAREKAARAGMDIDYRVAAAETLPFAAATFDVVVSSLMLHHLPEDLKPRFGRDPPGAETGGPPRGRRLPATDVPLGTPCASVVASPFGRGPQQFAGATGAPDGGRLLRDRVAGHGGRISRMRARSRGPLTAELRFMGVLGPLGHPVCACTPNRGQKRRLVVDGFTRPTRR